MMNVRIALNRLVDRLLPAKRVDMPWIRCDACGELERGTEITDAVASELPAGSSAEWRGGLFACLICMGRFRMRDALSRAADRLE